jgi:hypothetical protein
MQKYTEKKLNYHNLRLLETYFSNVKLAYVNAESESYIDGATIEGYNHFIINLDFYQRCLFSLYKHCHF